MLLLVMDMSATDKLFSREALSKDRIRYLGIDPTEGSIHKVTEKLAGFGSLGLKGFDLAIATFSILRGDNEHEKMPYFTDEGVEEYSRPFTFLTHDEIDVDGEETHGDHGMLNGYTYGLNVLGREMQDVEILGHEAGPETSVLAKNRNTTNFLIAQSVCVDDPTKADIEFGYFGVFPTNVDRVVGYLVLPKQDAVKIVAEAAISDSLV